MEYLLLQLHKYKPVWLYYGSAVGELNDKDFQRVVDDIHTWQVINVVSHLVAHLIQFLIMQLQTQIPFN